MTQKIWFSLLILPFLFILTGCNKQTTLQPTTQSAITIPTGWQTYNNTDHKLTLFYPSEWQLVPEITRPELLTFSFQLEEGSNFFQLNLRAEPNSNNLSSLDWAVRQVISESQEQAKQRYTPVTLGNYQAVKESGPVEPDGKMTSYIIAPGNNWAYEFTYSTGQNNHEQYLSLAEQIISLMKVN